MLRSLSATLLLTLLATACCDPQRTAPDASGTGAPAVPEGFVSGTIVTLRNSEGRYVEVQGEGELRGVLIASRDSAVEPAEFRVEQQSDGRIGLRVVGGKFVCADRDKGGLLVADRDYVGDWESFDLVPVGDDVFGLRTTHGKYVTSDLGIEGPARGRLIADRDQLGEWERFTIRTAEPR
jgi:hypothetical protein